MSHTLQLKNRKYRNWVRAALGLKYVKDGLVDFVDGNLKQIHNGIITNIQHAGGLTAVSCNQCNIRNIQPNHSRGTDKQCPFRFSSCNCQYPKGKNVCPQGICGAIYDEIVQLHASAPPCPYWKNANARLWSSDYLQVGKCFINAPGYTDKNLVSELDCSGLLHIVINNKAMQTHISCAITGKDVFSKTRHARNSILHSGKMELDDTEVDRYIDDMVTLLRDRKELHLKPAAIKAVDKLVKLKETTFCITDIDEAEIMKDALQAIERKKEEAIESIEQTFEEKKHELGDILTQEGTLKASEDTMNRLTALEDQLKQFRSDLKIDVESLRKEMSSLRLQIDSLDVAHTLISERKKRLEKRAEFQRSLLKLYRNHCTKVSIMPSSPEEQDVCIDEVYVTPWMVMQNQCEHEDENTDEESQNKSKHTVVHSYSQIFRKGNSKVKNIYIVGDAGTGKTTFCRNMLDSWCQAHDGKTTIQSADIAEMKEFDFLFFISLRHAHSESHINDMINNQLLICCENPEILSEVIENDSEKCLIILDGLDEWIPPEDNRPISPYETKGLPRRDIRQSYTILTTTRQWKLGVLHLTSKDIEQHISLLGMDDKSIVLMGKKVVPRLNQRFKRNKSTDEFVAELEKSNITELRFIPIMVQQLLCSWHDGQSLSGSRCSTYCSMFDMLLSWSDKRGSGNARFRTLVKTVHSILKQKAERSKLMDLALPRCFNGHNHCKMFILLIYYLGELAYHTLLSEKGERRLYFDYGFAIQQGLSEEEIEFALKIGVLTDDRIMTAASKERSRFIAYKHKSLQEFLCACFIAIHAMSSRSKSWFHFFIPNKSEESSQTVHLITQMFKHVNTTDKILEMSNMLLLLSGLYPPLYQHITDNVYQRVLEDHRLVASANYASKMPHIVKDIQEFVLKCVHERVSNDIPNALTRLHDVNVDSHINGRMFDYIDPDSVRSIYFHGLCKTSDMVNFTAKVGVCEHLQLISAKRLDNNTTITLINNIMTQSPATLEVLSIKNALFYLEDEIKYVLPDMRVLRTLQLKYILLTSQQLRILFSSLAEIKTLCHLELSDIQVIETSSVFQCPLDCGALDQLEVLKLEKFPFEIKKLSTNSLRQSELHFIDLEMSDLAVNAITCMRNASKLERFVISFSGIKTSIYNASVPDCLVRTLRTFHQMQHLSIRNMDFFKEQLFFTDKMHLKNVTLVSVKMSFDAWARLLSSLFCLPDSVLVKTVNLSITPRCMELIAFKYIRNEVDQFAIVYESSWCSEICFKTICSS